MAKMQEAYSAADAYPWLPPSEIAAHEAADEAAAEEAVAALATASDDDDDTDEGDDEAQAATEDQQEEDGEKSDAKVDDDPEPEAEDDKPEPVKPEPAPDLEALQKAVDDIKDKRKAALDQFNDGDIDEQEYSDLLDQLDEQGAEARVALKQAQDTAKADQEAWFGDVRGYLDQHAGLKENGTIQAFDAAVRRVSASPKAATMTNAEVLAAAHRILARDADELGINVPPAPGAAKPANKADKKADLPKGDESLGKTVKTLAQAPADKVSDLDSDSPFAYLESLSTKDPIAFEAQLAKLSADDRERYLAASLGD